MNTILARLGLRREKKPDQPDVAVRLAVESTDRNLRRNAELIRQVAALQHIVEQQNVQRRSRRATR